MDRLQRVLRAARMVSESSPPPATGDKQSMIGPIPPKVRMSWFVLSEAANEHTIKERSKYHQKKDCKEFAKSSFEFRRCQIQANRSADQAHQAHEFEAYLSHLGRASTRSKVHHASLMDPVHECSQGTDQQEPYLRPQTVLFLARCQERNKNKRNRTIQQNGCEILSFPFRRCCTHCRVWRVRSNA